MTIWKILLSIQQAEQCVYGDPAYLLRIHLQAPFRVGVLTRQMEIFSEKMSAVRASVEWVFADINYLKFLDFKKNLRIGLSQTGKGAYSLCKSTKRFNLPLFQHNCFGVDPPSLQDYFR